MKRRGRRSKQPFSLFAFQDVMTSVIGILFFIVIMMSLDMIMTSAESVPLDESPTTEELADLQRSIDSLRKRIAQVKQDIVEISEVGSRVRTDARGAVGDLKRMNATLRGIYGRIVDQRQRLRDLDAKAAKETSVRQNILLQITEANREITKLEHRIKNSQSGPRISYIIDKKTRDAKAPWLVELTGRRIRVAPGLRANSCVEFASVGLKKRAGQFLQWAQQHDPSRIYFVLLVKPSGAPIAEVMRAILEKAGYETGTDLLPEGWSAF